MQVMAAEYGQREASNLDDEDGDVEKLVVLDFHDETAVIEGSSVVSASRSHMASTIALCLCTLTHSWLLISVFPYSGFMAISLIPSANEENAGSYAGLLASSFMLGRAVSSYGWGKLADTYGRIFVLQSSLVLSGIFTLLFGLSRTFVLALIWRFLLGFGNGIIGTAKTAVSELAKGNEMLETRGMGLVMGMWGWGFLISPALSGALAEPVRQYPHISLLHQPHGWIHMIMNKYPFLLPNIVGCLFCLVASTAVSLFVEETLDSSQRRSPYLLVSDALTWLQGLCRSCKTWTLYPSKLCQGENTPLKHKHGYQEIETNNSNGEGHDKHTSNGHMDATDQSDHSRVGCIEISDHDDEQDEDDVLKESALKHTESSSMLCVSPRRALRKTCSKRCSGVQAIRRWSEASSSTVGTFPSVATDNMNQSSSVHNPTLSAIWSNQSTRCHLLVYWIYSFVSIQVDEAFPLFCISHTGGLGLSEDNIGKILSGSGIIFAILQYFVYATIVNRCGLYPSMYLSSFLGAPIIALIPLSVVFVRTRITQAGTNVLPWSTLIFLSVVMASYRIFSSIFFSSITVASNRTVPATQRASMNGLSMLGGSITKACGPAFAGFLVAFCLSSSFIPQRIGGALIFIVIAVQGIVVAFVAAIFLKENTDV